jgi:hypothetical protein
VTRMRRWSTRKWSRCQLTTMTWHLPVEKDDADTIARIATDSTFPIYPFKNTPRKNWSSEIQGKRGGDLTDEGRCEKSRAGGDQNRGAFARKAESNRAADPASSSGHHRDFSFQQHVLC